MEEIANRYINPYTDYGFKLLFGTEPNKDITLELVNALLQGKEVIKSLYHGILDFVFDEDKDDEEYYHHVVKLMDVNKKEVFYDKLTYIYLEMPKFQKTEDELETMVDKWLYALKNLPHLLERPKALQERIFKKFFDVAEIGNLSKEEYAKYFESEKVYYDNDGAIRTAEAKGIAKGREEGRAEGEQKKAFDIARNLLQMGMSSAQVSEVTGLTIEEIEIL